MSQRVQKLLEDAGIKLDSVVTDILGVSGRRMLEALIAGERDPEVLAEMAMARMRSKIETLREALVGRFNEHHAFLLRMHLDHIDELDAIEARLDAEVDRLMSPFAEAATRLLSIPGVGKRVAEVIVAEIGTDMSRFSTDKQLASWAGLCPGHDESAGKRRSGKARNGNPALCTAMCEAAWAASHSKDGYLPAERSSIASSDASAAAARPGRSSRSHDDRHRLARATRRRRVHRSRRRLLRTPHKC